MEPRPKIPFNGTSTSRSDFVKHENVEARQSVHVVPQYVPSKAPFYGQTTARDTFVKHDLNRVQNPAVAPSEPVMPPHIPFSGTSTQEAILSSTKMLRQDKVYTQCPRMYQAKHRFMDKRLLAMHL